MFNAGCSQSTNVQNNSSIRNTTTSSGLNNTSESTSSNVSNEEVENTANTQQQATTQQQVTTQQQTQQQQPIQNEASTESSSSVTLDKNQNKDVTVYVTNTGKKYHAAGCRYLSKSQIPISLKEAQNGGYEPCSVCNPPR